MIYRLGLIFAFKMVFNEQIKESEIVKIHWNVSKFDYINHRGTVIEGPLTDAQLEQYGVMSQVI